MNLKRVKKVRSELGRASRDRRHVVRKQIHDYQDEDGNTHRKVFEHRDGEIPYIPEEGTHEELNALREQWKPSAEGGAPAQMEAPELSDDEIAIAASASDVHPDDINSKAVAALVAAAESDLDKAQELIHAHASDKALAAASIQHLKQAGESGERDPEASAQEGDIDATTSVPLGGGRTSDGRETLIDKRIPEWIKVKGTWVNVWEEIDAHEKAEFVNIEKKGYQKAHDEDGNGATKEYLESRNIDPEAYAAALKPYLDAARKAAENGEADDIRPDLDRRPYEDSKLTGLLTAHLKLQEKEHAASPRKEPGRGRQEHQGTTPGKHLRQDGSQARQGHRQQAGGGNRPEERQEVRVRPVRPHPFAFGH